MSSKYIVYNYIVYINIKYRDLNELLCFCKYINFDTLHSSVSFCEWCLHRKSHSYYFRDVLSLIDDN